MCGITGLFHPDPSYQIAPPGTLQSMTNILGHRGPDDQGYYIGEGVGLGQRRLSIIDVCGGKQPICNENGSIWVVFNGEIFNYVELMASLKSKGHSFSTRSDTEVLVHLYEQYGDRFVNYLNGQFAIALWDSVRRELVLARDRVGIRPLYYTQLQNGLFLFGSEMKSIFCHPAISPQLDFIGLEQIFTLWTTVPPRTVFKGVQELLPGSILKVNTEKISVQRYWQLSFPDIHSYQEQPYSFYEERLKELMYDAVTLRLRADVPVAAYLSGGLDSSIISALVKKYHNNDLITFSVAFKDQLFDEREHQGAMAHFLHTDHRSIEVDYQDIGNLFSDVIWHAEHPLIRTAPAPLFALSKLVQDSNIKVVLTGEGADEVFGGYNIFKENRVRRFWAKDPSSSLRPLLLLKLYPYIKSETQNNQFWQLFFKRGLLNTHDPLYSHALRWANTSRIKRFFTEKHRSQFNETENVFGELSRVIHPDLHRWDPLCQAQYLEMTLFMSGYLLSSQGDRMMMGHSVEGRFPFLDYRIIEFANSIPPRYKLNGLNEKFILKTAYRDLIPAGIISRTKQPYRAPIAQCFTSGSGSLASRMLSQGAIESAGIFDSQGVKLLMSKANNSNSLSAVDDMAVAAIVSTQLLYHYFIGDLDKTTITPVMNNSQIPFNQHL